jgi:hypothetical protein
VFGAGLVTTGGSSSTFSAGTYVFGSGSSSCSGATYSICNTATLGFGGPSSFSIAGGVRNTGGSTLTMGSGTSNTFLIGASSNGDAMTLDGGSKTYMADATGPSSLFQLIGNLNDAGGGSCLMVSAAAQHDIEGNFNASGGVVLGAGVYSIDGYMALGAAGGGSGNCNGTAVSVYAQGVTIVLSGKVVPSSGNCAGLAFCVASGYSNVVFTAPTSGPTANLAVIGPSSNAAGAGFTQGGSNGQITGVFYFPNGPLLMSGGAGLSGGSSCLQIVASYITLSGGTTAASACSGSSSGSAQATIVQ